MAGRREDMKFPVRNPAGVWDYAKDGARVWWAELPESWVERFLAASEMPVIDRHPHG